jgi:hypothetical protein
VVDTPRMIDVKYPMKRKDHIRMNKEELQEGQEEKRRYISGHLGLIELGDCIEESH